LFVVALLPAPLLGAKQENSDVQARRQRIRVAGGADVAVQVCVANEGLTGIVLVGGDGWTPEAHGAGRMP
jgi:hypothetical protein